VPLPFPVLCTDAPLTPIAWKRFFFKTQMPTTRDPLVIQRDASRTRDFRTPFSFFHFLLQAQRTHQFLSGVLTADLPIHPFDLFFSPGAPPMSAGPYIVTFASKWALPLFLWRSVPSPKAQTFSYRTNAIRADASGCDSTSPPTINSLSVVAPGSWPWYHLSQSAVGDRCRIRRYPAVFRRDAPNSGSTTSADRRS